jgi:hypothetical protein
LPGGGRGGQGTQTRIGGQGNNNTDRPQCQVCLKYGHTADKCWYRYEEDYVPDQKHTATTDTTSYTVDTNWYVTRGPQTI